jgi:hypothetical protein
VIRSQLQQRTDMHINTAHKYNDNSMTPASVRDTQSKTQNRRHRRKAAHKNVTSDVLQQMTFNE